MKLELQIPGTKHSPQEFLERKVNYVSEKQKSFEFLTKVSCSQEAET